MQRGTTRSADIKRRRLFHAVNRISEDITSHTSGVRKASHGGREESKTVCAICGAERLSFAALKGFEDEIHEQEIRYEEKRILSEEKLEELDRTFHMLKEGMEVEVEFYLQSPVKPGRGQYYTASGEIEGVSGSSIWVQGQEISCGAITEIRSGSSHDLAGM